MKVIILLIIAVIFVGFILLRPAVFKKADPVVVSPIIKKDITVVAVGDISCNQLMVTNTACQQEATARLTEKLNPELVLVLGDLQYDIATNDNLMNFYDKSWGRVKNITKPAAGNHEYAEVGAKGYYDYFNGVGQFSGAAGDRDKGYYSYEKNGWKFYVLNSNCGEAGGCGEESLQGRWLEQELINNSSPCQIAYFHHPLFSSGLHGPVSMVLPLWQKLYNHQVDMIINGHDHLYERFTPQDPNGNIDQETGIREFVVGTGGRNLYQIVNTLPNSEKRISDTFGVLQLNLKENDYNWQFISIDNQVLDQGSAVCH